MKYVNKRYKFFHKILYLRYRFQPPDACYLELLRFRVRPPRGRELPMQARCVFIIQGNKVRISLHGACFLEIAKRKLSVKWRGLEYYLFFLP